jgi:hypothetical protein
MKKRMAALVVVSVLGIFAACDDDETDAPTNQGADASTGADGSSGGDATGTIDGSSSSDASEPTTDASTEDVVEGGADASSANGEAGADASKDVAEAGTDAAIEEAGVDAAEDAYGTCNSLTNAATDVPVTADGTAIPTGTGGTIADGTYFLTEVRAYSGSPVPNITFRQTAVISGGGTHAELVADDGDKPEYHESDTLAPNGSEITMTTTCTTEQDAVAVPYTSFTVDGNMLTLYCASLHFSVTYTKQ